MWKFVCGIAKKDWLIVFILPVFFVYLYNLSPGIFSADSGEMAAAAKTLGIPHPPGYPLYTLIAHLFLKIPVNLTPAGKISLFSVLTSILALCIFLKLLLKILKRKIISVTVVLILAFCYPFWLYSEVVEVFSLNNLLAIVLLYLSVLIYQERDKIKIKRYFLFFFFFIGLSLTHHHTIVLTFPALILLLYPKRKFLKDKWFFIKCLLLLVIGFSFYLYVPMAARKNPPINWDNAVNLKNLLRLITRADYGSFVYSQSGGAQTIEERLLQIPSFFYFLILDFGVIGFLLGISGFIFLYLKDKRLFLSFLAGFLVTGPFFSFYSAFPIYTSFVLGVFERFLMLSYIFWVISLGFGILAMRDILHKFFLKIGIKRLLGVSIILSELVFLVLPLKIFSLNRQKINLRNNFLGDFVGKDILDSLPKNSIVLLMGDLFVFNTQYVYYNLGYRNDVKIILASRFHLPYIRENFKRAYPEVSTPKNLTNKDFLRQLLELNRYKYSIFSVLMIDAPGKWYPHGFLYKLYDQEKINEKEVDLEVESVFSKYHQLEKYKNKINNTFLFADIFQTYALARITAGKYFIARKLYDKAKQQLFKAKELDQDLPEIYKYLGLISSKEKKCQEAERNFYIYQEKTKSRDKTTLYFYLEKTAYECFKDKKKTDKYHQLYLREKSTQEILLDKL